MKHEFRSDAARRTQRGWEAFMNCIARLLARRWLKDQRQENAQADANVLDGDQVLREEDGHSSTPAS